jgi:hypothetical protein
VVSNVATAAAIFVGAIWAYWRFLRERTRWPRAALSLQLVERPLDPETTLLAVKLLVTNEGRGLMKLSELRFDLYRVRPLGEEMGAKISAGCAYVDDHLDAAWPLIEQQRRAWEKKDRPQLEPGESDEYCCDFFLDSAEETVFLYAYLDNVKRGKLRRRPIGWTLSAFHDLQKTPNRGRLASLLRRRCER